VDYEMDWIGGDGVLTVSSAPADSDAPTVTVSSPPALTPIYGTPTITVTLTFDETIDMSTVDAGDFVSIGTAPYSIGTITDISTYPYPTVLKVDVVSSGLGTVQFRVTGTIEDYAGNALAVPVTGSDVYTLDTQPFGHYPVIVDAVAAFNNGSSPVSGTLDASGSDKLVVVVTGEHGFPNNLGGDCTSVTYDGVALTNVVERDPIGSAPSASVDQTYNEIWYMDNPGSVHTAGAIVANVSTRGNVTAFALSRTDPGVGATAISAQESKSVELITTTENSIVIASHGMGGDGNSANVTAVDTVAPLIETSAQENGSIWDGHVTGYMIVPSATTATPTFTGGNIVGTHTIAAEFPGLRRPTGSMFMFR
jgi:hypothetical protein